jgi:hypothetical protein
VGKIHNEELNDLYASPNIMWVIVSRRIKIGMAWVEKRGIQDFGGET